MKLNKQKKEVIKGMLDLLHPAFVPCNRKDKGAVLIEMGVLKDGNGKDIDPDTLYDFRDPKGSQVNHERALKKIVRQSKTNKIMTDSMAQYLIRYGKPELQKKAQEEKESLIITP